MVTHTSEHGGCGLSVLDLARWQFGVAAAYHFLFVPVTIGLGFLVAGFEAAWIRTRHDHWLRLTKFYGTLFGICFAVGVVSGLVMEFEIGVNWSRYSRFAGDIFDAPLTIEAMLGFFLEVVFLGLWIFGWDRLSAWLHAACLWAVLVVTSVTTWFILAENSWMQHPVGYRYNPVTHRAELTSFLAVLTNPAQLAAFPHTVAACFLVAGGLVTAIAMWHLMRRPGDEAVFRTAVRAGTLTTLAATVFTMITGDVQGKLMTRYQPMKMAAAEALYHSAKPAPFSLLTIGTLNGSRPVFEITLPRLLSFLATGDFNARVEGIDNLQALYERRYGPGSYKPIIPVAYWSFRLMIVTGLLIALISLIALWTVTRGRTPTPVAASRRPALSQTLLWLVLALPVLALAGNTLGWIFTEMARQPWLVFGLMKTSAGLSAHSAGGVLAWLILLILLYGAVVAAAGALMIKYARAGLPRSGLRAAFDGEDR
jgi:cytochrome d ubiquinol oxidase subunit I